MKKIGLTHWPRSPQTLNPSLNVLRYCAVSIDNHKTHFSSEQTTEKGKNGLNWLKLAKIPVLEKMSVIFGVSGIDSEG